MRLLTAQQVCDQFGIPNVRTVRTMRERGLPAVRLGKAYQYDIKDVERFIEESKTSCPAATPDHDLNGLKPVNAGTSSGTTEASNAFVQRAQQIATQLRQPSPNLSATITSLNGSQTR